MKKFTLFLTLFIAATMTIFAQDAANELKIVRTLPSSSESIEVISTSWEFVFSQEAKVADNAVKELEIKNAANEVIACVGLASVVSYENSIFTSIMANDTIWGEWFDDVTGETKKYIEELIYPTGLDVPGTYTMFIPAGTFVSKADNNIAIAETTLTFNVIGKQPKWWSDFDYQPTVNEFNKVTISFENVTDLKRDDNVIPYIITPAGTDEDGVVTVFEEKDEEGNAQYKIEITFSKYTEEGTPYEIIIPAGMFTMNGDVNNEEKSLYFTIVKPAEVTPLEIKNVTPDAGNVEGEITSIIITYNQSVGVAWAEGWTHVLSEQINLIDPEGNTIVLTQTGNYYLPLTQIEYAYLGETPEMNDYGFYKAVPITAAGTYTLDASQIIVAYGHDPVEYTYAAQGSAEGTFTWTIGETGIESIEAETENAEIYDLTGRRINEITKAGIYIVNGVKKVIK